MLRTICFVPMNIFSLDEFMSLLDPSEGVEIEVRERYCILTGSHDVFGGVTHRIESKDLATTILQLDFKGHRVNTTQAFSYE